MPSTTKRTAKTGGRKQARAGNGLLKEQAYHRLRELLLSGRLSEMSFVSERLLAEQLGMSNTPVRSAVERLELEGMIEIGPQRGVVVRDLSTAEIADHYEIREALECVVVRKLAGRLTRDQVKELQANLAVFDKSTKAGDAAELIRLDSDFHLLLAEFCGNTDIERILRQLRGRIHRVMVRVFSHVPTRVRETAKEHRQLLRALVDGKADQAIERMKQHLRNGLNVFVPAPAS